MKPLLALVALGSLGMTVAACGGSGSTDKPGTAARTSAATAIAPHTGETHVHVTNRPAVASPEKPLPPPPKPTRADRERVDRDEDDYLRMPDDHNSNPPGYVNAGPAVTRAVSAVVKRYYSVALKGDGAASCSMFLPTMAQAVPLDYGKLGPSYLRHAASNCPAVMSLLFKHEHSRLAWEVPQMHIVRVSMQGQRADAFLRFGRLHERVIPLWREGSSWRFASVLDGELE